MLLAALHGRAPCPADVANSRASEMAGVAPISNLRTVQMDGILLCFDQHPYLRYASTPLSGEEEALGWLGGSTLGEDRRLKMALVDP